MKPLSQTDCIALNSALEKIYSITSLEAFPSRVLSATRQLFPCDIACYNEIILPNTVANWVTDPADALGPVVKEMFLRILLSIQPWLIILRQVMEKAIEFLISSQVVNFIILPSITNISGDPT